MVSHSDYLHISVYVVPVFFLTYLASFSCHPEQDWEQELCHILHFFKKLDSTNDNSKHWPSTYCLLDHVLFAAIKSFYTHNKLMTWSVSVPYIFFLVRKLKKWFLKLICHTGKIELWTHNLDSRDHAFFFWRPRKFSINNCSRKLNERQFAKLRAIEKLVTGVTG